MQFNALPGQRAPYGIRNGQGPRHLLGGMVVSHYATGAETDDVFTLSMLTGGRDAGLPLLRHSQSHAGLFVLEGTIELVMAGKTYALQRGDYASIPAGTDYGFRMDRVRNVAMLFQTGGTAGKLAQAAGTPYSGYVQPEHGAGTYADFATGDYPDTTVIGGLPIGPHVAALRELPDGCVPYVIESGEGERLVVADQLFLFAGGNRQTGDGFLTLINEGPAGDMIPPHKHLLHDEMFFCLDGQIDMKAGDEVVSLFPGDWLFVPRGTPHAFQMKAQYTRTLGWLIPGIFEPFFHTLGEPYDGHVYPQQPGPFRFDRVIARLSELDIIPLGRPGGN